MLLPLGPSLSSLLCAVLLWDGLSLCSAVPGPLPPRFQGSRKGATPSAAPTSVPLSLVDSHRIMCSSLKNALVEEFNDLTGHTGVTCPLLIVGCGVYSTQVLKLRMRDTVWFPWGKGKWMWDGKKIFFNCQLCHEVCNKYMIELQTGWSLARRVFDSMYDRERRIPSTLTPFTPFLPSPFQLNSVSDYFV